MSFGSQRRSDDEGKFFVGNLNWETNNESLRDYFQKYGQVTDAVVITDRDTGRSRGFGFVTFQDPNCKNAVFRDEHNLDGRTVNAKPCNN